jgi:glutamate carboxypeptidase
MLRQRVPGVELKLEVEPDFKEPMICSVESLKMVHMAQDIAGSLGFDVNHVLTGGSSDGSYTTGYGVPTLDGLGPIGGLDHSPNEYLLLSSVAPRTALLGGLIASIGK